MPDPFDPLNPLVRSPLSYVDPRDQASGAMLSSAMLAGMPTLPSVALTRPAPVSAPSANVYMDPMGGVPVPIARRRAVVNPTGTRDLSVTAFAPGLGMQVSELLQAIPMVKGSPLIDTGKSTTVTATTLAVQVQRMRTATTVKFYDATNAPSVLNGELTDPEIFTLARTGLAINALQIDSTVGVRGTANNPLDLQVKAAGSQIIRQVDAAIGGASSGATPFRPLADLLIGTRKTATSGDLEADAALALTGVFPTGGGAGEGPDCLIGGPKVMRALMATSSGRTGLSGWRRDPRTGLLIYHYMGVPFYRAMLDESTTAYLYAASLGVTGLNMVYAYGTAESYGLQVDENPFSSTTGMRQLLVHGAYALVTWEEESIFAITGIPV